MTNHQTTAGPPLRESRPLAGVPGAAPFPSPASKDALMDAKPVPGQWVVFEDSGFIRFTFGRALVEKVTPKQVTVSRNTRWTKRLSLLWIRACVATEDEAKLLIQSLDGVAGEFRRRLRAAEDDRSKRVAEADDAARKQIARLIASAMSVRQDQDPQGLEAQPASATGAAGDARKVGA